MMAMHQPNASIQRNSVTYNAERMHLHLKIVTKCYLTTEKQMHQQKAMPYSQTSALSCIE